MWALLVGKTSPAFNFWLTRPFSPICQSSHAIHTIVDIYNYLLYPSAPQSLNAPRSWDPRGLTVPPCLSGIFVCFTPLFSAVISVCAPDSELGAKAWGWLEFIIN